MTSLALCDVYCESHQVYYRHSVRDALDPLPSQHLRSHVLTESEAPKKSAAPATVAADEASCVVFQQLFISLGSAMVHDDACLLLL